MIDTRRDAPPEDVRMAEVAALVGDPARANILSALMGGRALIASALAYAVGVSAHGAL
jgi:uridine phosphorylase